MRVKIWGADYRKILLSLVGQERPSSEKYFWVAVSEERNNKKKKWRFRYRKWRLRHRTGKSTKCRGWGKECLEKAQKVGRSQLMQYHAVRYVWIFFYSKWEPLTKKLQEHVIIVKFSYHTQKIKRVRGNFWRWWMFVTLIMVRISLVYAYLQTDQIVYINIYNFFVSQS